VRDLLVMIVLGRQLASLSCLRFLLKLVLTTSTAGYSRQPEVLASKQTTLLVTHTSPPQLPPNFLQRIPVTGWGLPLLNIYIQPVKIFRVSDGPIVYTRDDPLRYTGTRALLYSVQRLYSKRRATLNVQYTPRLTDQGE
jgi:hypothetical protein